MKTIYLVRHCEYANPRKIIPGRLPVELSEQGRARAERLREYFGDKGIEKIYSSAVLRCKKTSEVIGEERLPIVFDRRLLEGFTAYQGFWFEGEVDTIHFYSQHFYSHREELGGERLEEIQKRMVDFFEEIIKKEENRFIICSHGDPIYLLYLKLAGMPMMDENFQASTLPGYPPKGSIIKVDYNKGKTKAYPFLEV